MSSGISKLPPPFPNAAQALTRVATDAQLRARVEQASENAPIRAEAEIAKSALKSASLGSLSDNVSSETGTSENSGKVDINV